MSAEDGTKPKGPRGRPTEEQNARRQPLDAIPVDLTCLLCEKRFKTEAAYRGHMWQAHGTLYERRPTTVAIERFLKRVKNEEMQPETRTSLEPWHAVAIAQHELFGKTYPQIAEESRGGRGLDTMAKIANSPAGKLLRSKIAEIVGEPLTLVKFLLENHMLQGVADHMAAKDWAREAKDYKALHAMNRDVDLLPYLESMRKSEPAGAPTLIVNLSGGQLDTARVATDYVVVEADAHPEE